ncbi:hypothetical protein JYT16_02385 [Gemmatimonas aurantiaca]|nr:hypothetical protein [Gemmatimonas aurantiaca]
MNGKLKFGMVLLAFCAALTTIGSSRANATRQHDSLYFALSAEDGFVTGEGDSAIVDSGLVSLNFALRWDSTGTNVLSHIHAKILFHIDSIEFDTMYATNWGEDLYASVDTSGDIVTVTAKWYNGTIAPPSVSTTLGVLRVRTKCAFAGDTLNITFGSHPNNYAEIDNSSYEPGTNNYTARIVSVFTSSCCASVGDADNDGSLAIGDVTFLIARIFSGGSAPICCSSADVNADGQISINDVVALIQRIFTSGAELRCGCCS